MERLDKLIAATGKWSRKEAKALVKAGRVRVAGEIPRGPEDKVEPGTPVTVDGHPIDTETFLYLMLHKPAGVVSSTEDPKEETVLSLLPKEYRKMGLFPVGRLDKDTEGLLLLTNDGQLAHRLLSPGRHVDKVYYAEVEGELKPEDADAFREGLCLRDGTLCLPAELTLLEDPGQCLVTLREGKYHQVKRMLASRGTPVTYLKRLSMGPIELDRSLPKGAWRPLLPKELALLSQNWEWIRRFPQKNTKKLLKLIGETGIIGKNRFLLCGDLLRHRGAINDMGGMSMSSRVFQSIVLQMKECTDRVIGVVDDQGTVVSCNQLTWIGEKWEGAASALNVNESAVITYGDKTFKPLASRSSHFDYAAFVQGSDEQSKLICSMVTVALNSAKAYYEEKYDKTAFVKSIISDNILLGDIYVRAKELHFASEATRAVFLVRQVDSAEIAAVDVVQNMFSDSQEDFVISINESDIVVIKMLSEGGDSKEIYKIAKSIEDALAQNLKIKTTIGIGTVVSHIRDLARAYKEAGVAIDVGKVFDTEKTIINYENLGIGRLIYQLPTVMCEMFLQEVFKKNPIDALDQETLFTINKFFENNLNVSETARKLFVHRNTLVYRLEKIKKLTGLDLREFDDAITFKVALMVKKYLVSRGIEN